MGWPTRHKHGRSKRQHALIGMRDGTLKKIPLSEYSTPTLLYRFTQADILSSLPVNQADKHWSVSVFADTSKDPTLKRKYPLWDGKYQLKTRPYEFARFIAKVGHAYAVAELGVSAFSHGVTDLILGKDRNIFYRVGGLFELQPIRGESNHWFDLEFKSINSRAVHVVVGIRMFAMIEGPYYHVVVGEINLDNPIHVSNLEQHISNGKIVQEALDFTRIGPVLIR
jgi:hypothetical protein